MGQNVPLSAAVTALALALGSGCTGMKFWGKEPTMAAQGVPSSPLSQQVRSETGVVQASATTPQNGESSWSSSFAKLTGKSERKTQATEMTMLWRNRIDYLPDQTRNGQMSPGLAGQVFLFDRAMQPALPDGKLIVALYDETPRPPGQEGNKPEGWEFNKETLRQLIGVDERFGRCCVLFLPWPTFRADVTHVRIAARYEPENGYPLYATETHITLDHSAPGSQPRVEWSNQVVPGVQTPGGMFTAPDLGASAMPPNYGVLPQAPPGYGSLPQTPPGAISPLGGRMGAAGMPPAPPGGVGINAGGLPPPAGLQPIVTVLGR